MRFGGNRVSYVLYTAPLLVATVLCSYASGTSEPLPTGHVPPVCGVDECREMDYQPFSTIFLYEPKTQTHTPMHTDDKVVKMLEPYKTINHPFRLAEVANVPFALVRSQQGVRSQWLVTTGRFRGLTYGHFDSTTAEQ